MNTLKDVDRSKELAEFHGEDSRLRVQVEEMRTKLFQIYDIFAKIQQAPPQNKVSTIDSCRPQMEEIEKDIEKMSTFIDR